MCSRYPALYVHSRQESVTWTWIAEWMQTEIARRGLKQRRAFNNVSLRRYMSLHRAELIEVWGEDGVKATRYIQAFDGILAVMNASGNASVISQDDVSFSVEDLVGQLVEERGQQQQARVRSR